MRFLKKKSIPLENQKEIFCNVIVERTGQFEKSHNSVTFQNLVYHFKGPTRNTDFNDFIYPEILSNDVKSKKIRFEDALKSQMEIK